MTKKKKAASKAPPRKRPIFTSTIDPVLEEALVSHCERAGKTKADVIDTVLSDFLLGSTNALDGVRHGKISKKPRPFRRKRLGTQKED